MSARTLLFSDLVDSTALIARVGDAQAAAIWTEHDRRARQLLKAHRGQEIDRSDGFFMLFDEVMDAAAFAQGYHAALADLGLAARVGIHVGDVSLRRNAAEDVAAGAKPLEVDGLAKPLAARIMALAGGGRTLLSGEAALELGASRTFTLRARGHYRLKGVDDPQAIVELNGDNHPPPPDTEKAYRVIELDGLWLPLREVPHNLPPERDAFVGRQSELAALARQFEGGARLVTLLGPGGTGKTRLVRRFARAWLGEWPGGAWFCDLSQARSPHGVHAAVAAALGVPLSRADPAEQLGHAIAARGRCLVILDNAEQVVEHVAAAAEHWLDRAASARFIVTSRERLHISGEVASEVEPLALAGDAMQLFEVRARAQRADFALDDSNRGAVAEAVRLLDGLPLAIELAAARTRMLTPQQIVQRLADRFTLLAGARGAAARQATLRAAIDWSWELLAPWEQSALAQCSVFAGGFTLDAAEAVLDLSPWRDAPPAIDVVQALVDKSLLRVWMPNAAKRMDIAETHFGMYLSIHDYASRKLDAIGKPARETAQQRHGRHFARLGDEAAIRSLVKHGGVQRRQRLTLELDNLELACRLAIERQQAEIAAACYRAVWAVLVMRGPFDVALALGRGVTALPGLTPRHRVLALLALSMAARETGALPSSEEALHEALAVAQAAHDGYAEGMVLGRLAVMRDDQGAVDDAEALYQRAIALLGDAESTWLRALTLGNLASLHYQRGHIDQARSDHEESLALLREVGHRYAEGVVLGNLGELLFGAGEIPAARAAYEAALVVHRETGSLLQEAITLGNLGNLARCLGELEAAGPALKRSHELMRQIGSRFNEGVAIGQIGELHQALGAFDAARTHYEQALCVLRETGNRRGEGSVLGNLGEMLALQGRHAEAVQALQAGERLLRDVDDPLALAKLLCRKAQAARANADPAAARQALAEAQTIAVQLGTGPGSELGRAIEALRQALPGSAPA